jgi:hypothetical protein
MGGIMTDLEGLYYIAIDVPKEHTDAVDAAIEELKVLAEAVRRQRLED